MTEAMWLQKPTNLLPMGQSRHHSITSSYVNLMMGLYLIRFACADRIRTRIRSGKSLHL